MATFNQFDKLVASTNMIKKFNYHLLTDWYASNYIMIIACTHYYNFFYNLKQ